MYLDIVWKDGTRKGQHAGVFEIHKLPTRLIESTIKTISELAGKDSPHDRNWHRDCELTLDYLFAELGRRVARKIVE